ncbi:MAG: class I SAM-dependent methyltransferase [Acidimicrobiales bacterium]|jgi:16S rRNA (guanine527-N7)-methyltransferase|nr:class I SAM-dependent methyltransferase [Acidimicrobiales bacterium]
MSADLTTVLEEAQAIGALGPGPIADHLAHAERFVHALGDTTGRVLDLGSGNGLPGLVIAEQRPDLLVTLLDAQARRVEVLHTAVARLGLADRVTARHGRAEVVARLPGERGAYQAVVARSFGPPGVVAECAVGFLGPDGLLLVSEPPDAPPRWPEEGLAELGLRRGELVDGIQHLHATGPCPDRYPRRDGMPAKRPLF